MKGADHPAGLQCEAGRSHHHSAGVRHGPRKPASSARSRRCCSSRAASTVRSALPAVVATRTADRRIAASKAVSLSSVFRGSTPGISGQNSGDTATQTSALIPSRSTATFKRIGLISRRPRGFGVQPNAISGEVAGLVSVPLVAWAQIVGSDLSGDDRLDPRGLAGRNWPLAAQPLTHSGRADTQRTGQCGGPTRFGNRTTDRIAHDGQHHRQCLLFAQGIAYQPSQSRKLGNA